MKIELDGNESIDIKVGNDKIITLTRIEGDLCIHKQTHTRDKTLIKLLHEERFGLGNYVQF